jgi:hypothetical protein
MSESPEFVSSKVSAAEIQAELRFDTEPDAQAELQFETAAEAPAETRFATQLETEIETKLETKLESLPMTLAPTLAETDVVNEIKVNEVEVNKIRTPIVTQAETRPETPMEAQTETPPSIQMETTTETQVVTPVVKPDGQVTPRPVPQAVPLNDRPFRVKLRGSVLVLIKLPNKRQLRAALHQLSTSGGVINLEKPLDEKIEVELIFHIDRSTIRGKAQMLFPMWATQGWMQPFRFVELSDADREALKDNLQSFVGNMAKGASANG